MQIGQQGDGKVGIRAFFVNNDWIVPDGHLSAMKKSVYAGSKDRKGNKAPADGQLFWKGREHGGIADIPEAGQGSFRCQVLRRSGSGGRSLEPGIKI